MKINFLLFSLFASILIYASVNYDDGIVGTTRLNGDGCVCHNLNPDPGVSVWIEGPSELNQGQTGNYTIYLSGGPMVDGGFNVASRFNTLGVDDPNTQLMQGELTHVAPLPFVGDTVSWTFTVTASTSEEWDTLYATANSVNGDLIPDTLDRWNWSPNFPVHILPPTPVELISFSAKVINNGIGLSWSTATETNNKGFEIERKESSDIKNSGEWKHIGFVKGYGTTSELNSYKFTDKNISAGDYYYRLKQIDYNGGYKYSNAVEVKFNPVSFSLEQNYPNPFNPSTTISYNLTNQSFVRLNIYNSIGELIDQLVNSRQKSGSYNIVWNAKNNPSGVYFYQLQILDYQNNVTATAVKKMILLK